MSFRIGNWVVEPEHDRIVRQGEERLLRPQVMDILVYLAEHQGATVSNEELMAELWAGKIVTPGTLYNAVNELRRALDDDAQDPRYIKTIPKRGYCLIAEVEEVRSADITDFASIMTQGESSAALAPENKLNWAGATVIIAVLAVLAWTMALPYLDRGLDSRQTNPPVSTRSIAVLPFDDMSPDQDQAYFANGLSEEILNRLAQLPKLKVTGRISSFALRDTRATVTQIGELLGVSHVLEGSVRKDGDEVRITAQLINAQDGYHVWSRVYERQLTELFQIQDEIAQEIVGVLELSLLDDEEGVGELLPRAFRPSVQAHDYYLRASELARQQTKESLQAAYDALESALDLEPEFTAAHVAKAQVIIDLADYVDFADREQGPAMAQQHIERALQLDPNLATAWSTLGLYYLALGYDEGVEDHIQLAEDALRKAVDLDPDDARAHNFLSWVAGNRLVSWAAHTEHLERAVEIEPLWTEPATELALRLAYLPHRADQSAAIFDRLLEIYPDKARILFWKAHWLRFQGRLAEAVRLLEDSLIKDPDFRFANLVLKKLWYHLGEPDRAEQLRGFPVSWRTVFSADREAVMEDLVEFDMELTSREESVEGWLPFIAYAYLLVDQPEDALRVLGHDAGKQNLEFLEGVDFMWANTAECPLMTMATSFKLLGETAFFEQSLDKILESLSIRSENGNFKNTEYWRVMARVHALRGEDYSALLALERLTADGALDPREMMHPAYDEIRHTDEFMALVEKRAGLLNSQRVLLGLEEKDMVAYQRAQ